MGIVDYLLSARGSRAMSAAYVAKVSATLIEAGIGLRDPLKGSFQKLFGVDGSDGLDAGVRSGPGFAGGR